MQRLVYFIFRFFVFLFSLIPFWLLYRISDFLCRILYNVVGYRYKVIRKNLENAFPEKTTSEIEQLVKGAYRNLSDILVEGIKGLSLSDADCRKRYFVKNPEVMNDFFDRGQSIILLGSHYTNWEWGPHAVALQLKHHTIGIVADIKNPYINDFIQNGRTFKNVSVEHPRDTSKTFETYKDQLAAYVFIMDQSPYRPAKAQWIQFLNQKTPCAQGADTYARRLDIPVIFAEQQRAKRGHYEITFSVMEAQPATTKVGSITLGYMSRLEQMIKHQPENWLWSHRRWKHEWKDGYDWVE